MYQRRRARILIGVLLFVSLVLVTIDVRGGEGNLLDRLRGTATTVLAPIQDGASTLVRPLGDASSNVRELFRIRTENAELRSRVSELEERRRSQADLERENRELRELLELRDHAELETVAARAVALAPSSFEWTITIDVGANDGVERDMPVVNGDGLVGRVIQVTPSSSRVLLAIDPSFSAASRAARTGEIGTLSGRGGDPMTMQPLDPGADIEVGDVIVTSSYAGGVFPGGIPIGVVTEAGDPTARLTRTLQVLPYVDFTRLHHLQVVLNAPVDPIPPLDGTGDIPFVPPPVEGDPTGEEADTDEDPSDADGDADGDEEGDSAGDEGPEDGEG
jgi:rod shape-determining protein MreC